MYGPQGNYSAVQGKITFFKYEDTSSDTHTVEAQSLVCKINTDVQKKLQSKLDNNILVRLVHYKFH